MRNGQMAIGEVAVCPYFCLHGISVGAPEGQGVSMDDGGPD